MTLSFIKIIHRKTWNTLLNDIYPLIKAVITKILF